MQLLANCFEIDIESDLHSFVRTNDIKRLSSRLLIFCESISPRRFILIGGALGTGKSKCALAAIRNLEKYGKKIVPIIISGNKCGTIKNLSVSILRKFHKNFKYDVLNNDVHSISELITKILKKDQITRVELSNIAIKLCNIDSNIELKDVILTMLGLQDITQSNESGFIIIRNENRLRILQSFFSDVYRCSGFQTLILIDNLDQMGVLERIEEIIRFLFGLRDQIILVTALPENIPANISRELSYRMVLEPMSPEEMVSMIGERLRIHCPEYNTLLKAGLTNIAHKLAQLTDNQMVLMKWLEYIFLYEYPNIDDIISIIKEDYPSFKFDILPNDVDILLSIGIFDRDISTEDLLKDFGISKSDLEYFETKGILLPMDYATKQTDKRYILSPFLKFSYTRGANLCS